MNKKTPNEILDGYIESQDEPFYESCRETLSVAAEEMIIPPPSTRLDGMPIFSNMTGGFRPQEFSILCGATGVGKTTFLANISKHLLLQQVPHFVASVETGRVDFLKRVISAMSREDWNSGDAVPLEKIKNFTINNLHHFDTGHLKLSRYDNRFSVEQLMSDIAWMVKRYQIKLAMIDNLNFFMEVIRSSEQIIEMDRVIHELVIFCKRIDVHLIMVMHPKKTDKGTRVESEYDIKGSSTAVQEAHNVFLLNRAGSDLIKDQLAGQDDREILIAKMRRRGKSVYKRLIFKCINGVTYDEGAIVWNTSN